MSSSNVFDIVKFLFSRLVTDSRFISIPLLVQNLSQFLFVKDLSRYLETENTLVWILNNIWRLRRVRVTKFDLNISKEKSLIAEKWRVYRFYRFWVIKGKPIGDKNPPWPRFGLNVNNWLSAKLFY